MTSNPQDAPPKETPTPTPTTPPAPAPAQAPAPANSRQNPAAGSEPSQQQQPPPPPQPTKDSSKQAKDNAAPGSATAEKSTENLSPAELKKRAKAEKQARRAREKEEREGGAAGSQGQGHGQAPPAKKGGPPTGGGGGGGGSHHHHHHHHNNQKQLPLRQGPAQNPGQAAAAAVASEQQQKKKEQNIYNNKRVAVFGHLYGQQRRTSIAGAGKEVHPAVLALGLQMREYEVCGSSARCLIMLLAFKRVIQAYTTPLGTSLSRHLTTHLSHQISYLSTCRPLSISQGNAIRALKLAIASIDPSTAESTAKKSLCDFIDRFSREKIILADQVIVKSAIEKIQDGDVIVTFAGSSLVKQILLAAHEEGKKFRVSIIDSRPLFEGKALARALANAGLDVEYSLVHGISHAIKDATKVFLGAHGMTSNGRLYSRVGTALVAMSAKERSGRVEIPVIVCCETVKFSDRVALDSIVVNEIADADELVSVHPHQQVTGLDADEPQQSESTKKGGKAVPVPSSTPTQTPISSSVSSNSSPLKDWKETPNLQLLNIMYDVTPAEYVDMIITEMGSLPPSAVPIVHRMSTNS